METKDQLKVMALAQRIGEITSNYEERIADLRADATIQVQRLQEENRRLNELLEDARAEARAE